MIGYAVNYYQDMVRPHKTYRLADVNEAINLEILKTALAGLPMIVMARLFNQLFMQLARRPIMKICVTGLSACIRCFSASLKALVWDHFCALWPYKKHSID